MNDHDPKYVVELLKTLLTSRRMSSSDEYRLQREVGDLLCNCSALKYWPEFRLDPKGKDRIDFYFPDSKVGIECKVKAGGGDTNRQLLRYAMTQKVTHLVLLTSRPHESLPAFFEVEGKQIPLTVIQLATL